MDNNIYNRNKLLMEKVAKGLSSRNMTPHLAENKAQALEIAMGLIEGGSVVTWGGSASIEEIGLKEAVLKGGYDVLNRDACKDKEEKRQLEIASFGSDYYLCSCNAITEDGILVNIDANSNRVAAISYGPKHVIMVVGMNKVEKDVEAAMSRARNTASPINAQRFPISAPCKKTGSCANCKVIDTLCCQFLVTRFSRHEDRIHVILVNDDLGF